MDVRRIDETITPGSPGDAEAGARAGAAAHGSGPRDTGRAARALRVGWALLLLAGAAGLVVGLLDLGPSWLPGVASVALATAYSWALVARTGGRPVVFGVLTAVVGAIVLVLDQPLLRTGAAVAVATLAAVLAVMSTVPGARYRRAALECVIAILLAGLGALAAVALDPEVDLARFQYVVLGLSLAGALGVVYRLGAGLHGLGRRGVVAALAGAVLVLATALYADLLTRYGTPSLVGRFQEVVVQVRDTVGAFPRPVEALVGVPALAWGCHMRARRPQGWWLCAFGTAATSSVAARLVDPGPSLAAGALAVLYGLLIGLVIGYLLVRLDLALTGARGRRGRRAEQGSSLRPEPRRTTALR